MTGHFEELCRQQEERADMQKPVGLWYVHWGSIFSHVVQNRAQHDDYKVQRFDSIGSYTISNTLSSYPGYSKIKIYFFLFPQEGCANPQFLESIYCKWISSTKENDDWRTISLGIVLNILEITTLQEEGIQISTNQ